MTVINKPTVNDILLITIDGVLYYNHKRFPYLWSMDGGNSWIDLNTEPTPDGFAEIKFPLKLN